jgi:hypothetical protein
MEKHCIFCEVTTENLNIIYKKFRFKIGQLIEHK